MACGGCGQARQAFVGAVRRGDVGGALRAVGTAININYDKLKGVDVNKKYGGGGQTPAIKQGQPYRRPGRAV